MPVDEQPRGRRASISDDWDASVTQALRETLEAYASPTLAVEILLGALADGGYEAPPAHVEELRDFVVGPLCSEISAVLGADTADAVRDHMAIFFRTMRTDRVELRSSVTPARGTPMGDVDDLVGTSRSDRPSLSPRSTPPASRRIEARPTSKPDLPAIAPRPTSRPDLPAVAPRPTTSEALVASVASARDDAPSQTTTYRAPEPDLPFAPRALPRLSLSGPRPSPIDAMSEPRPAPAAPAPDARLFREPSVPTLPLVDLGVVTDDEALIERIEARFGGRIVAVGALFDGLPRARVVLLDTRHAFEALRATWPAARSPDTVLLWPAEAREGSLFQAIQPHVREVVCAGDEAELEDVVALLALQLTRSC